MPWPVHLLGFGTPRLWPPPPGWSADWACGVVGGVTSPTEMHWPWPVARTGLNSFSWKKMGSKNLNSVCIVFPGVFFCVFDFCKIQTERSMPASILTFTKKSLEISIPVSLFYCPLSLPELMKYYNSSLQNMNFVVRERIKAAIHLIIEDQFKGLRESHTDWKR